MLYTKLNFIIEESYVNNILVNESPEYIFASDEKWIIKIYKFKNILLGVLPKGCSNNFDDSIDIYYKTTELNEITSINNICKELNDLFAKMKFYKIFEDIDIDFYTRKFNDKIKYQLCKFIDILKSMESFKEEIKE